MLNASLPPPTTPTSKPTNLNGFGAAANRWLLCAQSGELEPVDLSPPVPPGLAKLSASLTSLAEFLRIDRTLIRVAAEPAAKSRTVADLMQNLEAASRKQSRFIRGTLSL